MAPVDVKRIALAYSGGLDTSIIIPWLKERYPGAEVVAVCADVGQSDDLSGLQARASASGAVKLILRDVRREFVEEYLFPMLRAGAVYEGKYLLGTSAARPLQAKVQVESARAEGADALAHGCHRQGQRSGAVRVGLSGARARSGDHRAVASVGHPLARGRDRLRGAPRDRLGRHLAAQHLFAGRQRLASQPRRRRPGGRRPAPAGGAVPALGLAGSRSRPGNRRSPSSSCAASP